MSPLRLNGTTSGYTELSAPATAGSNTLTLPTGNGTNGQYLQTNGSGVLSWATVAGSQWTTTGSNIYYTTGSVGVGTTSPGAKFHSIGGTTSGGVDTAAIFTGGVLNAIGSGARIYLSGAPGYETTRGAYIEGVFDTATNAHSLRFATNASSSDPVEQMRIKNDGVILMGSTGNTGVERLEVTETNYSSNGYCILTKTTGSGTKYHIRFLQAGSVVGSITSNGSATAYNTSSDYRLKENVVPLTGAADRVNQLQVHRFNFITDPDKTVDGFIAHEAQAVVPECVTGTKDEVDDDGNPVYQGIDQSKLVPLLTAALQEALAEIENLKASNAALETSIAALEVTP